MVQQIQAAGPFVVCSWGAHAWRATVQGENPCLTFLVNGLMHKGRVNVILDEGSDLYNVQLVNNAGRVIKTREGVYCDELGRVIDNLVERPADMTDAEYRARVLATLHR